MTLRFHKASFFVFLNRRCQKKKFSEKKGICSRLMALGSTSSLSFFSFISDTGLLWVFQPLCFYGMAPKFLLCASQTFSWQRTQRFLTEFAEFFCSVKGSQIDFSSWSHCAVPWDEVDPSDLHTLSPPLTCYTHRRRSKKDFLAFGQS